jgi:hypothetical protein
MTMTTTVVPGRGGGLAAGIGGLTILVLGVIGAVRPDSASGPWFVAAGLAAALLATGIVGLRATAGDVTVARRALAVAAVAMSLFALAHFYALVDEDLAVLLFSVFMVVASAAMIVAGVAILRHGTRRGWARAVPLVCGAWPILTVPAGAALGDLPHFAAIAGWGLCWVALGTSLLARPAPRSRGPRLAFSPWHVHDARGAEGRR